MFTNPATLDPLPRRHRPRMRFDGRRRPTVHSDERLDHRPEPVDNLRQHRNLGRPLGHPLPALGRHRADPGEHLLVVGERLDKERCPREMLDQIQQVAPSALLPERGEVDPAECEVDLDSLAVALDQSGEAAPSGRLPSNAVTL